MESVRWVRWAVPMLAGLALIGSSVACGAGQFRLRSASAEPVAQEPRLPVQDVVSAPVTAIPPVTPTATAAPTAAPTPATPKVRTAVVQVKALRVRSGPGTQHKIVAGVKQGQDLRVLGQNEDGSWLQVTLGNMQGWVATEFVKVTEAETAPPDGQAPGSTHTISNPVARSLAVSSQEIQAFYEELGFVFVPAKSPEGLDQLIGANHSQQASVTLTGPEDALTAAAMTAVTRYDQETVVLSAAYLLGFVKRVMPGWTEGPDWVEEHLRDARNGESATATVGAATARLTGSREAITLVFAGQ